jgi:hypothetical protein
LKAVLVLAVLLASVSACALVPQNRRARLADPIMRFDEDPLEAHKRSKFYSTRTGAAGGDGVSAGGGCGCQ